MSELEALLKLFSLKVYASETGAFKVQLEQFWEEHFQFGTKGALW